MKINFASVVDSRPHAFAMIKGSTSFPEIKGTVYLYQSEYGVIVTSEISGLPENTDTYNRPVFGLHIHEGEACSGNMQDPFSDALTHYNPDNYPHPYHSGDMPPLFGNNGLAFSSFLTNRFNLDEIIGKTIIIHSSPDDFTTQPSGNSGTKIACGKIIKNV